MIKNLFIENFILIDKLEINFEKGLTVLTGETGAGKSLIISSIESLLGNNKNNSKCIGNYKDYSYIEATFSLNYECRKILEENNFSEFDNYITISKIIKKSFSKYRINGILVTNNLVKQIGETLVDIIGQHDNQHLFKSNKHIYFLDSLGDKHHKSLLFKIKEVYQKTVSLKNLYQKLNKDFLESRRQLDFYKFQLNEIKEANLKVNEDIELKEERDLLLNSQEIINTLNKAYNILYSSNEYSLIDNLSNVLKELYNISKFSSDIEDACINMENILSSLKEISRTLRFKAENIDTNPYRLNQLEERLNTINNLKKKYGNSIEEIINFSIELENKLNSIENGEENLEEILKQILELEKEYIYLSEKISLNRKIIASKLEKEIENELKDLCMENTLFRVNFSKKTFSENGTDEIEFLIKTNTGEELKPLSKIASGGEISRIMLALQIVINKSNNVSTLIFDEIDTGISGKTSLTVSQKLNKLSLSSQVICITHLPTIAAISDNHFWIEKFSLDNKTKINVTKLNKNDRIEKIAQISSGIINDKTLKYAKELCLKADDYKLALKI